MDLNELLIITVLTFLIIGTNNDFNEWLQRSTPINKKEQGERNEALLWTRSKKISSEIKLLEKSFKRTISRLYELTSMKYN